MAKELPQKLAECESKKIIDIYVENGSEHPDLRIRQNGSKYELTRKTPVNDDASTQTETTITLNAQEFKSLSTTTARKIEKTRYLFPHGDLVAEFDVFEGALAGLVLIDFEFTDEARKQAFVMPEYCLTDVTQETFIAGGVLAGKSYEDIASDLDRFQYQKLNMR